MGIVFARILGVNRILTVFTRPVAIGTKLFYKPADKRAAKTRTVTNFTEPLTNSGKADSEPSETFYEARNTCDVCTEQEALGFCYDCEQYTCSQCCKHHEKISLSQKNTLVGKNECRKLTVLKFTERFTNFDSVELGSTETFDQTCNICDLYAKKEAVGFCCVCEQYMCYQCCRHHEKISLSKNHNIVGKDDFGKLGKETSLFEMRLVPLTVGYLPACLHGTSECPGLSECSKSSSLLAVFSMNYARNICYLLCSKEGTSRDLELGIISPDTAYEKIKRSTNDLTGENVTVKYFVFTRTRYIWLMKYDKVSVFYKGLLTTSGACYDAVPFDDGLAVSVHIQTGCSLPDWQIQYIDFKGKVKRQIYCDSRGKQLFKRPDHLASNETGDILFVSDSKKNSVIALDPKGNVIYKFTHSSIQSPTGLTCDEENNVYVSCKHKVIQIDKHGKKCRVLLDAKTKDIIDICYDKIDRKLAVIEASKTITIFALLP